MPIDLEFHTWYFLTLHLGFGIGAISLIVPVYIAEASPPSIRGRLVGMFEIASQAAGMCGFWINYVVDRTISSDTRAQWILPLGLQLLPGVCLLLGMLWCPESPRWLARQGRCPLRGIFAARSNFSLSIDDWEGAEKVLVNIRLLSRDNPYIRNEMAEMKQQVENRSVLTKKQALRKLLANGTRNRLGVGLVLTACQNMTGVNIITYYSPRIFETLGIQGTSTKLFATGFYGIAKTLGMIIFSFYLVEKVGRRKGLIYGAFVGSIPMWYM
jgi:MFS family permease